MVSRGRGRSRDQMGRGGALNRMVVDHRPRALSILGVTAEEKEELMPHFVVRSRWDLRILIMIYYNNDNKTLSLCASIQHNL